MAFLQNWVAQAKEHWKEFRPKLYASLEKSGKLNEALQKAARLTYVDLTALEDQGFDPQGAWEMVRERYLFPPEEGKKPTAYSESWDKRPALTDALHAAMNSGARTMPIPQPAGSKPPAESEAKPPWPADYGAKNKLVTAEHAEEIRARLREKLKGQ